MSVLSLRSPPSMSTPRQLTRTPPPSVEPAASRRVASEALLDGQRELVIQHQGSEYRLRLTRNDKLILTK